MTIKRTLPDLLSHTGLFQDQPADVLAAVGAAMKEMRHPAGVHIFSRGDPGDSLFLILSGRVRISILTPDGRELSFSVTGMTKDNAAKVKESLQGLMTHAYQCAACKVEQATAGKCPKCQGALESVSHAVFQQVQPSADGATLAVKLDPAATLRLSELDTALGKNSVKIDPAHFTLPGRARLVLKGATADAAPAIEKALTDAKLFEEVKAKFDPATSELAVMVKAGSNAPTRAKVTETIEAAKAKLADVIWAPMGAKS